MTKLFFQAAGVLTALTLGAGIIQIDQDFADKKLFSASKTGTAGNSKTVNGGWNRIDGKNFAIVSDASFSGSQALRIRRVSPANLHIFTSRKAQPGTDSRIVFHVKLQDPQKSAFSIRFNTPANKRIAFLRFQPGGNVFSVLGKEQQAIGTIKGNGMQVLEFIIPPRGKHAKMRIYEPDKAAPEFKTIPIEQAGAVETILLSNAPDSKADVFVDKVQLSYSKNKSVLFRSNIAAIGKTTVKDAKPRRFSGKVTDGKLSADVVEVLRGLPGEIEIELPQPQSVCAVRLHSGISEYLKNPSKDLSVTSYKVEVFSTAAGKWRELGVVNNAPVAKTLNEPDFKRFSQFDFPPIEMTKLRLTILKSSDTGKRAMVVKPLPTAVIREVELYSSANSAQGISGLAKCLQAEFRVPVYRHQKVAGLHAILDKSVKSLDIEISMRDRNNGTVPAKPIHVTLKPGLNIINIDISKFPNGEFRTLLRAADKKAGIYGEFARLLRLERIPALKPLVMPENFAGKRMYFPDFRYAAQHSNLICKPFPPECYPLNQAFIEPEQFVQLGSSIGFDASGRLVMKFTDRNWYWQNIKTRYAVSGFPNIKWKVENTCPAGFKPEQAPITKLHCEDWSSRYRNSDGKKFRFYDPVKDGKPDLRQLRIVHTGYQPRVWGGVEIKPQTTWVIWAKSSNEYILLHRKPFLTDGISGDEFEEPTNTNDNFSGQWLSEDGKTIYYARGRMLRRYAPFTARYDNLWMGARIQAIFSSQDGINFTRSYFMPPEESDPPTGQQYGATIYKAPQGNGLMTAFMYPYSALHQQYYPELIYSWDGLNWNRFSGNPAWIPAGKPGEWNFGLLNLHNNILTRNNKYYHVLGWACAVPHCHAEIRRLGAKSKITAEAIRKSFQPRELEKWPYFKHYGSWEKLAEAWRNDGSHCGVSVYRQDGWFGMTTQPGKNGFLTTCKIRATGGLSANITVGKGGFCRITAVDNAGKVLMQKTLAAGTDNVKTPVFSKVPAQEFQLKLEMKNTVLYSLNF